MTVFFPYIHTAQNVPAIYDGGNLQYCHILRVDISLDIRYDIYISRGDTSDTPEQNMVVTGQNSFGMTDSLHWRIDSQSRQDDM